MSGFKPFLKAELFFTIAIPLTCQTDDSGAALVHLGSRSQIPPAKLSPNPVLLPLSAGL